MSGTILFSTSHTVSFDPVSPKKMVKWSFFKRWWGRDRLLYNLYFKDEDLRPNEIN